MIIRKLTLVTTAVLALTMMISVVPPLPARALGTDTIHLVKYASDGVTVLGETTMDSSTMQSTLPTYGDGTAHYYLQGPTLDQSDLWDAGETVNVEDKGAVKGTALMDLCNLVGGAVSGEKVTLTTSDGYQIQFDAGDIYNPEPAQGTMVLCWYKDGMYTPNFDDGLQLMFMTEETNAAGQRVFGNNDMKVCLPESDWQYYYNSSDQTDYPSSNKLAVKHIAEIRIRSAQTQVSRDNTSQLQTPAFNVLSVSVSPAKVYPGEEVTVTAQIMNGGNAAGSYQAMLLVNGEQRTSRSVSVAAGGTADTAFTLTEDSVGEYSVKIGNRSAMFSVEEKPDIDESGVLMRTAAFRASDNHAEVVCPEGTKVTSETGTPVTRIMVTQAGDPPAPLQARQRVSAAYNFGPDGSRFDEPVTIKLEYDDALLPSGTDETDLVAGVLETGTQDWEYLEDAVIDTVANTITFDTTHFSMYAVFTLPVETKASFSYSGLTITPNSVVPGTDVTVSVTVTNTGTADGSDTVSLLLDGNVESEQTVTLSAGDSQQVTFSLQENEVGTYSVGAGGLTGSFTVGVDVAGDILDHSDTDTGTVDEIDAEQDTASEATGVSPTDSPERTGGVPWLPVILGIAGVLLVGVVFILYRRKTRVNG